MNNLEFLKLVLERFDVCWYDTIEENIIKLEINDYNNDFDGMTFYFNENGQYLPNYDRIKYLEEDIANKQEELKMLKKVLTEKNLNDII